MFRERERGYPVEVKNIAFCVKTQKTNEKNTFALSLYLESTEKTNVLFILGKTWLTFFLG